MIENNFKQLQLALPPQVGEDVFYIRGFNPVKGNVFDRLAIFKKRIKEITSSGYIAEDNESLYHSSVFANIEEAEAEMIERQGFIEYSFDLEIICRKHTTKHKSKSKNMQKYSSHKK